MKKFSTHLWFNTLQKIGREGTYLKRVKAIYCKPIANIILNGEKLKAFPLRSRNKTRVCTFTTVIQHSSGSPSYNNQRRKRNKRIHITKEVKLSPFADDMILYRENPKDSIRKLLELINEISKVVGCKTNTQKSLAFLYTNNEKWESEIKESIPFTISTKIIKYLGINLPKETKELYTENCDTDERNQRWHKQMERYSMFLEKNFYFSGLQNHCRWWLQPWN